MNPPRPRFGLRTLLVVVTICASYVIERDGFTTKRYPVVDLFMGNANTERQATELGKLIKWTSPHSWHEVGGAGWLRFTGGAFVVSQTDEGHKEIRELLASLRASKNLLNGADARVRSALNQPFTFHFRSMRLEGILKQIAGEAGLAIRVDNVAIQELEVDLDSLVSLDVRKTQLREALDRLLEPRGLDHNVWDGSVWIVRAGECPSNELRIYSVERFVDHGIQGEAIIAILEETIEPGTWENLGGPGSAKYFAKANCILVWHTPYTHTQIQRFLKDFQPSAAGCKHPTALGDPK